MQEHKQHKWHRQGLALGDKQGLKHKHCTQKAEPHMDVYSVQYLQGPLSVSGAVNTTVVVRITYVYVYKVIRNNSVLLQIY